MLGLERLRIALGDFRLAADWELPAGARLALIGPSGGGKSTLLAAIAGFIAPASGRILWQGQDLAPLPPGRRPLSILFQDQNLFPHLSAAQNVGLGLRPDLRLSPAERVAVEAALARVGLAGLGARRPGQLSGGQQARVALARVVLRARPLLLLDEAFSALGPALRAEMLALVAGVVEANGTTLLMVTHDIGDARALCGLTSLVAEGSVTPPRPTAALLADPPPALAEYLGWRPE